MLNLNQLLGDCCVDIIESNRGFHDQFEEYGVYNMIYIIIIILILRKVSESEKRSIKLYRSDWLLEYNEIQTYILTQVSTYDYIFLGRPQKCDGYIFLCSIDPHYFGNIHGSSNILDALGRLESDKKTTTNKRKKASQKKNDKASKNNDQEEEEVDSLGIIKEIVKGKGYVRLLTQTQGSVISADSIQRNVEMHNAAFNMAK